MPHMSKFFSLSLLFADYDSLQLNSLKYISYLVMPILWVYAIVC